MLEFIPINWNKIMHTQTADRDDQLDEFKMHICKLADRGGIRPDEMIGIAMTIVSANLALAIGLNARSRQLAHELLDGFLDDAAVMKAQMHPDDRGQVH